MEGTRLLRRPTRAMTAGLTLPVAEYGHDEGCSVTGGAVYRGTAQPALAGWYVFADYCSGRMWVLTRGRPSTVDAGPGQISPALGSATGSISAIAPGPDGELLRDRPPRRRAPAGRRRRLTGR